MFNSACKGFAAQTFFSIYIVLFMLGLLVKRSS